MPNQNLSAPLSATISLGPGATGSSVLGAVNATSEAWNITTLANPSKESQRDSILKAMQVIVDMISVRRDKPIAGNDLFPDMIQDLLALTHNGVATTVLGGFFAPVSLTSQVAQLPIDTFICIREILKTANIKEFSKTEQASTLKFDEAKTGFFANCQFLLLNCRDMSEAVNNNIDKEFKDHGTAGRTHSFTANGLSFTALAGAFGTIGTVDAIFDSFGAIFRELTAFADFMRRETKDPQEKNFYQAISNSCASISLSQNCEETLVALDEMEKALFNFEQAKQMANKHIVSSPVTSVASRIASVGPFLTSLRAFNSSCVAIAEAHKAMTQDKDQFSQRTAESAKKASLLKDVSNGDAKTHSQNVSDFSRQFDQAIAHIDKDLEELPNNKSIGSTAAGTIRGHSTVVIASSLVAGLFGLISRELSGTVDFTKNDKGTKAECGVVSQSRSDMTGADLDQLMTRVCALRERLDRCQELGVSAPVVMGLSEVATGGSLVASLNMLAGMISALREIRTLSQSPSIPVQLNDAEKKRVAQSVASIQRSHRDKGKSMGSEMVSENLTAEKGLQSVMEKVVLLERVFNNSFKPNNPRNDIDYSAKSTLDTTGFALGFLGVTALAGLETGVSAQALLAALRVSTAAKRVSDGPDKIESGKASKFNASLLSNATRLTEGSQNNSSSGRSLTATTYVPLELTASRSITVALCHSGALKEILRRLVDEENAKVQDAPGHMKSAVTSVNVMHQLYPKILEVLDKAEANHNPILGLNGDMASQLAGISNSTLASAICSHSSLIAPFLKSSVAARKASVIDEKEKNEALIGSDLSQKISQCLNTIQAFSLNSMDETQRIPNPFEGGTFKASDSTSAHTAVAACATAVLIEELFEMCVSRSLTLLDRAKVDACSKDTKENTNKQAAESRNQVAEDSGSNEKSASTHVTSALRLTLSHLGVSLVNLGSEFKTKRNLLQDNLEIHPIQKSIVNSMASTLSRCGSAMLAMAGSLTASPLSCVGSIEGMRDSLHTSDISLVLEPMDSSQRSTKGDSSESSLITGASTDCVTSLLSTITKLLLQATVLGLDTTLSIAKIMEILSLHPRPEQALALEIAALSQPNGASPNIQVQTASTLVAGSIGLAAGSIASKTGNSQSTEDSRESFQRAIDAQIDKLGFLEDEEENASEAKKAHNPETKQVFGLKRFYALLLAALSSQLTSDESKKRDFYSEYKDDVARLNRGGYNLSQYHRAHGGIIDPDARKNHRSNFLEKNDAAEIMRLFIQRSSDYFKNVDFCILYKVAKVLANSKPLSKKVESCWEHIVNNVINRNQLHETSENVTNSSTKNRVRTDHAAIRKLLIDDVFGTVELNPAYEGQAKPVDSDNEAPSTGRASKTENVDDDDPDLDVDTDNSSMNSARSTSTTSTTADVDNESTLIDDDAEEVHSDDYDNHSAGMRPS